MARLLFALAGLAVLAAVAASMSGVPADGVGKAQASPIYITITAKAEGDLIPTPNSSGNVTNGDFEIWYNPAHPPTGDGIDERTTWTFDFTTDPDWADFEACKVLATPELTPELTSAVLTLHLTPRHHLITTDSVAMTDLSVDPLRSILNFPSMNSQIQSLSVLPLGQYHTVAGELLDDVTSNEILHVLNHMEPPGEVSMMYQDDSIVSFAELELTLECPLIVDKVIEALWADMVGASYTSPELPQWFKMVDPMRCEEQPDNRPGWPPIDPGAAPRQVIYSGTSVLLFTDEIDWSSHDVNVTKLAILAGVNFGANDPACWVAIDSNPPGPDPVTQVVQEEPEPAGCSNLEDPPAGPGALQWRIALPDSAAPQRFDRCYAYYHVVKVPKDPDVKFKAPADASLWLYETLKFCDDRDEDAWATDCPGEPKDNCPDVYNADQTDADDDTVGDACDACLVDAEDLDGVQDDDGCPETDADGDDVPDEEDNCPVDPNPGQEDADGDTVGDACDDCPDDAEDPDGIQDDDGCPETDADGDGIPDEEDSCPEDPEDLDGIQDDDGCVETDVDGDGIHDDFDNCPEIANPGQEDSGGDGTGDACEPIGGTTELFVDGSDSPASAAEGSGSSSPPYAILAGAAAAAALAIVAGGWYARRRLS